MAERYKYAPGGYRFVGFVFGQGQVWHVTRSRRGSSILYCCFTWKAYCTAAAQTRPLFIRHVSRFSTVETRSLAFEKYRIVCIHFTVLKKLSWKNILLQLIIQSYLIGWTWKKKKKINEERERTKIKKIVNKFRWSIYEEKSRKSMCVKNDDRIWLHLRASEDSSDFSNDYRRFEVAIKLDCINLRNSVWAISLSYYRRISFSPWKPRRNRRIEPETKASSE